MTEEWMKKIIIDAIVEAALRVFCYIWIGHFVLFVFGHILDLIAPTK